jgi:Mrp family chromosome partitioning ATPase
MYMGRMLDALRVLANRRLEQPAPQPASVPFRRDPPPASIVEGGDGSSKPLAVPVEPSPVSPSMFEMCALPAISTVSDSYLALCKRISEQLASSYCNVLLFVSADDAGRASFSMTHLAQAFALHSNGNVLLVDGDLRGGRLSKTVCPNAAGFIEAMSGTASWPEIIHPTTTPRVDFVARGNSPIPTVERPDFGWSALRPKYRAVLIGISISGEPETDWLSARCDGVYFVISRPHTKRHAATVAVTSLGACGANVLGCILANS